MSLKTVLPSKLKVSAEDGVSKKTVSEGAKGKRLLEELTKALDDTTVSNLAESSSFMKNFYRLLTNERCDIRHGMLDPDVLTHCCPLDNGRHDTPGTQFMATSSLGSLIILPVEIMQMILVEALDLDTLTLVRSVSRGLRHTIDDLPRYRAIITYAPSSLRAALSLEVASGYSCNDLYNALCSTGCYLCDKFGAFVYLFTCKRVCFRCFTEKPNNLAMKREHAKYHWTISSGQMEQAKVPVARSIPGRYGQGESQEVQRTRLSLVDCFTAGEVAISKYDHVRDDYMTARYQTDSQNILRWGVRYQVWVAGGSDPKHKPRFPRYFQWVDRQSSEPTRYMCILPFPSLSRTSGQVEWGVACNGCNDLPNGKNKAATEEFEEALAKKNSLYPHAGYIKHFLECQKAQELFLAEYEAIVGKADLIHRFHPGHPKCDIAGIPDVEFYKGRYPDPSRIGYNPSWNDLTSAERGKKRWDSLKPKQRRRHAASGVASSGEAASGQAAVTGCTQN